MNDKQIIARVEALSPEAFQALPREEYEAYHAAKLRQSKRDRHVKALRIKQRGQLVGLDGRFELWLYEDCIYSIDAGDLDNLAIWCPLSKLRAHLVRLCQITGHPFCQGKDVYTFRPDFWKQYEA